MTATRPEVLDPCAGVAVKGGVVRENLVAAIPACH